MSTLHSRLTRIALQELTGQAYTTVEDQAQAMAAVMLNTLREDGFAIVELPEPSSIDEWGNRVFHDGAVIAFLPSESLLTRGAIAQLRVHDDWDCVDWYPDDLRTYAAALLAAADVIEAGA